MVNLSKLSDEQVVGYVCKQDKEAYAEIINRYQDKLRRYAIYLTGDDDKAADVVQETFIKAYTNLNGFNLKKKFSSWIYRIAHNEAMNALRKHYKHRHLPILEEVDFDSGTNLQDDLIKKELQENVRRCLKKMPILYGGPLTLYFLEEKSYEEISDILRMPLGTVGTRINRAKILMKKICQKIKK